MKKKLDWEEKYLKKNLGWYVVDAFDYVSKRGIKYRVMKNVDGERVYVIVARSGNGHIANSSYPVKCTKEVAKIIREEWGNDISIFAEA